MENTKRILKDLISFDTTYEKEGSIMNYISNFFSSSEFKVVRQNVPTLENKQQRYNIIATKGNPELFFFGHLDTVRVANGWNTDPFEPIEKDNYMSGLGAVDMKGGITASLAAMQNTNPENIGFCFTCDEEYDFKGIKKLIETDIMKQYPIKLGVFCEPTNLEIVNTHRGCIEFKIEVEGKSAHAARKHEGVNASQTYLALKNLENDLEDEFKGVGMNIGYFESGYIRRINSVPDYAKAVVDIRPTKELTEKGVEYIENKIRSGVQLYGLNLKTFLVNFNMKPLSVDEKEISFLKDILEQNQIETIYTDLGGCSEAGEVNYNYNIPCINFGPGPKKLAHKPNEKVDLQMLSKCKSVYESLIKKYN